MKFIRQSNMVGWLQRAGGLREQSLSTGLERWNDKRGPVWTFGSG